jgi:hypothetical protein
VLLCSWRRTASAVVILRSESFEVSGSSSSL